MRYATENESENNEWPLQPCNDWNRTVNVISVVVIAV